MGGNCISTSTTSPMASWLHQPAPSTLGVNTHVFTGSSTTSLHRAFYTNTCHQHWGQRTLVSVTSPTTSRHRIIYTNKLHQHWGQQHQCVHYVADDIPAHYWSTSTYVVLALVAATPVHLQHRRGTPAPLSSTTTTRADVYSGTLCYGHADGIPV